MNIIGVVTLTLVSCGLYAVPRIVGRRLFSYKLAKFSIGMIVGGVSLLYVTLIFLGVSEGNIIREGKTYAQARAQVTGDLHDWIFVALYTIIGIGYLTYMYNLGRTLGSEVLGDFFGQVGKNFGRSWSYLMAINLPKASLEQAEQNLNLKAEAGAADSGGPEYGNLVVTNRGNGAADSGTEPTPETQKRYITPLSRIVGIPTIQILLAEILPGLMGFLGVGWLLSRRPAFAMFLFTMWQFIFWVCFWAVAVLFAPEQIPIFAVVYCLLPVLSGVGAAVTYRHRADKIKQELSVNLKSTTKNVSVDSKIK
jgi:hypothetical protein